MTFARNTNSHNRYDEKQKEDSGVVKQLPDQTWGALDVVRQRAKPLYFNLNIPELIVTCFCFLLSSFYILIVRTQQCSNKLIHLGEYITHVEQIHYACQAPKRK